MRWRFGVVAIATVVAMLVTGCSPEGRWVDRQVSSGPSANPGTVSWRNCVDEARDIAGSGLPSGLTFQCGTVTVPQDWATATPDGKASDGRTFDLALIRIRANGQSNRIGSLLMNPGGPGGSGLEFAVLTVSRYTDLLKRFDLIGFDPRGVGKSDPVKCMSDKDLDASFAYDPDPVSQAAFDGAVALTRKTVEPCGTKYGEQLRLFSTEQAARDMDAIRAAVGDEKMTYLGYSYGTLLGAVYAQLFPTKIRALVLDGAVDPQQSSIEGSEGQAKGFERAFTNFSQWCSGSPSRCPIAPDARAAVTAAFNQARANPVRGKDGRLATSGWILTAVVSSLYSQEAWPYLARAISDLGKGNADFTFLLADLYAERDDNGHYSNLFDANNAVNCADADDQPTLQQIRTLQGQWRTTYPMFGAPIAMGLVNCVVWPGKHDPYPVGPANGAPPIVVVGTTGDPATPYESTAKLATMLGTGVVLTWEGEGHTAYPETTCIRNAVNRYLIDLKPPAEGTRCPA